MNTVNIKWRTLLALAVIYAAILFEWNWVWGVLFLMWLIPGFYSGRTHLIEEINRDQHPLYYWLIMSTWVALSAYFILVDLIAVF